MAKAKNTKEDRILLNFNNGISLVRSHALFGPLAKHVYFRTAQTGDVYSNGSPAPAKDGWAVVSPDGTIIVHATRLASPEEWAYVLAHCLLHLAFDQHNGWLAKEEWQVACCAVVARFLRDLKFGSRPEMINDNVDVVAKEANAVYEYLIGRGLTAEFRQLSVAGANSPDMISATKRSYCRNNWQELFARGLSDAVRSAVDDAGNLDADAPERRRLTQAERAKQWFINHFPLLGALAAGFRLIEQPSICSREQIGIAAVNPELQEMYINAAAGLDDEELRFVMAHEFLHVGLRHETRTQGRDHYLWNVACDYVINHWLLEMDIGRPPSGVLIDDELKGLSAEAVYDRIVNDLRRARKLRTLRGNCEHGDIMKGATPRWWSAGNGVDLDEFYRRCLAAGLGYHLEMRRGTIPLGLVEEINALSQPPIPWDVALARWFDEQFPPLDKQRSYARPSRRQASTPDIARPRYWQPPGAEARTFAVVLDTSGSMDRTLLAKSLGCIASYALSRDVPAARVIFCDAHAYDQGYLNPCDIAGRVKVRGRGGTILQPGIDLLERVPDFPKNGPLLIITDGGCDILRVRRTHAFLIPSWASLPFSPTGKVFNIS